MHNSPPAYSFRRSGLTLLELSIVLVIIALLAGGIMIGRDMLRQSQVMGVMAQVQRYESAIVNFKKKYNALPGDMPNAESMWGSDTSCPNTAANTTPKRATCNGNGDGRIYNDVAGTEMYETHRAWQHLANAELIEGIYTGAPGAGFASQQIQQINSPRLPIPVAVLHPMHQHALASDTDLFPFIGHGLTLCDERTVACGGVISGSEAFTIDSKFDDGLPGTGRIITWKPAYLANCATTSNPYTAKYHPTDSTQNCALLFQVNVE